MASSDSNHEKQFEKINGNLDGCHRENQARFKEMNVSLKECADENQARFDAMNVNLKEYADENRADFQKLDASFKVCSILFVAFSNECVQCAIIEHGKASHKASSH